MKKVAILILFMLGCAISEGHAQKVALKSNLLYDATTTMLMDGGTVTIEWEEATGHILMTGPATKVFDGEMEG